MQGMRLATGVLCVSLAMLAMAEPSSLRVFLSGPASEALTAFQQRLLQTSPALEITDNAPSADILVPVGDRAFTAISADVPVFGVQVSRRQLDSRRQNGCRCSGIYAGARPADQLALLETLLPGAQRIGVILSESDNALGDELTRAAGDRRSIRVEAVASADQLPAALADLLPVVDVLLLLPDPQLFNADTARLLLLTSYRQGRPVIGPDSAFVRAGSLASVDASTEDLVSHTRTMLQSHIDGIIPPPDYAAETITVNPHVARTYGVAPTDSETLAEAIWGRP